MTSWSIACHVPLSMEFLGKNTGVGCYSLLQGIFLTQGSSLCLLHCRQILYHLSHQGSPVALKHAVNSRAREPLILYRFLIFRMKAYVKKGSIKCCGCWVQFRIRPGDKDLNAYSFGGGGGPGS